MIKSLISRLPSSIKTEIIDQETTKWLRIAFTSADNQVLNQEIIDNLIFEYYLPIISRKPYILDLIDAYDSHDLRNCNCSTYEELEIRYKNRNNIVIDWNVPIELIDPPKPLAFPCFLDVNMKYGSEIKSNGYPHFYQLEIKSRVYKNLIKLKYGCMISLPTGAGKTRLAMELIVDLIRTGSCSKFIWTVNRKELLEQAIEVFSRLWSEKGDREFRCIRYFGEYDDLSVLTENCIVFVGLDLFGSRIHDKEEKLKYLLGKVDFLIFDECHHSVASTYSEIISIYKEVNQNYRYLGLTATPYRNVDETVILRNNFNDIFYIEDENGVVEYPIQYLIEHGFLSNVEFKRLDILEDESIDSEREVFTSVGNLVLDLIRLNKRTVIFAKSKQHAIALNVYLCSLGVKSAVITGDVKDTLRINLIESLKEARLNVLVNHNILSTGLDIPGLESIVILNNIQSPSLALQTIGRAMRGPKNGGNVSNAVYLLPSNYKYFSDMNTLSDIVFN